MLVRSLKAEWLELSAVHFLVAFDCRFEITNSAADVRLYVLFRAFDHRR